MKKIFSTLPGLEVEKALFPVVQMSGINGMASIHTARRDCRSHRSPSSIDHHLLPLLSHL